MEEQGREARWAQIKIEIEGSQAQQGKKIEVKGQIERESAEEEKPLVGLLLVGSTKDLLFNEFYSRPGGGEILLMQTIGETIDGSRFLLHLLVVANL